ncbi:MAG: hypothetical protein ACOX4D_01245 [Bacteroidales bacterium]|jgi:hypothetical protein
MKTDLKFNSKTQLNDEKMRQLMKHAKLSAPEDIKPFVMDKIEASEIRSEQCKTLKPEVGNVAKDYFIVFGIMYIVLIVISIFTYFNSGKGSLFSSDFIKIIISVAVIFSFLWLMISIFLYTNIQMKKRFSKFDIDSEVKR